MFGGRRSKRKNLLAMYPVRLYEWEGREPGLVTVLVPKFGSRPGKRVGKALGISEHYRNNLDERGSFVWLKMDGNTNVKAILASVEERFGKDAAGIERLAQFIQDLELRGLIRISSEIEGCRG